MGASGSTADVDFALQKEIAKAILKTYDVSSDGVRVGIIVYGRTASFRWRLDYTGDDRTRTLTAIDNLRLLSRGNNLEQALQLANLYIFSPRYGGRPGVPKILVVFNNKPVDSGAFAFARAALNKGYMIANVAVGDEIRPQDGSKLTGRVDLSLIVKTDSEAPLVAQALAVLLRPSMIIDPILFVALYATDLYIPAIIAVLESLISTNTEGDLLSICYERASDLQLKCSHRYSIQ